MTTAPVDPMLGRLIDGRYQVRSRIARGGMATVYLATDLRLERRVAIKIMHGHLADDNTFKTRFVQEARSAARLAHPNVVNVFDQGQDADMAYLVMEYLPGITLRDLLKDYQRLTPEQTVDIMDAVLAGLAAAHKAGIVHRDLKPENVLLADDGRIKLGDFGLARAASANTATGQALLGTIAYLSPELVTRGVADARSDIYAVGIMMYEMLTGEQPYVGEAPMQIAYQHANDQVPTPSSKFSGVPPELDELVLWATSRDPEQRPADARAMLDRLREVEGAVRGVAGPVPALYQPTMVLADTTATAETRVLNPASAPVPTALAAPEEQGEESAALSARASARKRKGYWLFALVLLLAGLAGGTGWYFGAGPGASVTVPVTAGLEPAAAEQVLTDAGFQVAQGERYDPEIAAGLVSGTDPAEGAQARRGATVTVLVSLGPRILQVPDVVGDPEAAAREALGDFTVGDEVVKQFSDEIDAGAVVGLLDASGAPLPAEYAERGAITLIVSVGAVPQVAGMTLADAEAALDAVGLEASQGEPQFSDEVPIDVVISAEAQNDPMRPGDSVLLVVSKGPDLVEVPNVVTGQTIAAAREQLEALDFAVTSNVPGFLEGAVVAAKQSVAPGERVKRGTEISVNF
ncbi:Stk1 family PASTA domain-containing Ser/Thr kinase [Agromyces mediolanus]|uniref:non-specific serine/threonine protein kinase n=2 Tax=Agromyces mediolanus TaxID=41986 RepID=A0A918FHC2_AGRME|nr:Stk1 family PASTA domain-containing Ser/Thr kinase [Agromyces mediolanus]GGR37867.1 serine/threonine protein kinase [Agromyces mediolanus]GLJ72916.1 serine/threonine protein kinase [Agromyces mediolanus]